MVSAGEFVLGYPEEGKSGARPHPEWMKDGSFQVFRRLSQDVPGWWAQISHRHQSLPSDDPMQPDLLAAKLVGRWRSGTPLAHAPERDNRSARDPDRDNEFDYRDDPDGHKTPRFAHIRKMYPRHDSAIGPNKRRIIRRGIPFGSAFDPSSGRSYGVDADRGLLFNVFMASIEDQFEFLQMVWANNPDFRQASDGPDPIIGDDPKPVTLLRPDAPPLNLDFRRFVHTTGAVYAFAPALTILKRLASGEL
jgi:Dyp-type peroxidase family